MRPSPFYLFAGAVGWPFTYGVYRLRAEGVDNVPRDGGAVLAANHTSNVDPWPLAIPLWPRRFVRFMAKSELFWWPLGPIISSAGAFPVRRGERDVEAIRTAIELARAGDVVGMFPHGTRQRKGLAKKHQPRAHSGAARIALEGGVPLIPAAIAGTDRLSRFGPIRVRYGKPIALNGLDPHEATDVLMAEIERLREAM